MGPQIRLRVQREHQHGGGYHEKREERKSAYEAWYPPPLLFDWRSLLGDFTVVIASNRLGVSPSSTDYQKVHKIQKVEISPPRSCLNSVV